MSIRTIDINQYKQFFNVSLQNKHKYGKNKWKSQFKVISYTIHPEYIDKGRKDIMMGRDFAIALVEI